MPISEAAGEVYSYAKAKPIPAEEEEASLWLYLTTAALLVILGGVFAGLTIAYVDTSFYSRQSITVENTSPMPITRVVRNEIAFFSADPQYRTRDTTCSHFIIG